MNSPPPFTLRIRTEQDQDIDWMVQPEEITFHQALEVISRIVPDTTTTAFQYVDEDGEKITVRSDEELKAMFQMYFGELSEEDVARGLLPPLIIYPRVGKKPKDRNIHDLKIKTVKPSVTQIGSTTSQNPRHASNQQTVLAPTGTQRPPMHVSPPQGPSHVSPPQGPSHVSPPQGPSQMPQPHQQGTAENIKQILTCGAIVASDLQQLEMIGSGVGGQVYKAFHLPTQRLMAVKVIQLDVDVEVQRTILSELEILYKCQSPAIIGFYGAFFIENRISICTEYMDGGALDTYGQIPEEILGRITVRIVQGLMYMWSLKILHRDIKPSNILVNTGGEVKLCDFGVSTQLVASIAMTYVGTNAYMAPERIKAENYGAPSEIWSLGVMVFELATGQFPFKDTLTQANPLQFCKSIIESTPTVLPTSHFSPELADLVARCMQKNPETRITHYELLAHPFIQRYITDQQTTQVLSAWVKSHLQQRMAVS